MSWLFQAGSKPEESRKKAGRKPEESHWEKECAESLRLPANENTTEFGPAEPPGPGRAAGLGPKLISGTLPDRHHSDPPDETVPGWVRPRATACHAGPGRAIPRPSGGWPRSVPGRVGASTRSSRTGCSCSTAPSWGVLWTDVGGVWRFGEGGGACGYDVSSFSVQEIDVKDLLTLRCNCRKLQWWVRKSESIGAVTVEAA